QGGSRGRAQPGRPGPRAVGQRRAQGGRGAGRRARGGGGRRRPGRRNGSRGYPRGTAGRRAGGCDRHGKVTNVSETEYNPEDNGPVGGSRGGAGGGGGSPTPAPPL